MVARKPRQLLLPGLGDLDRPPAARTRPGRKLPVPSHKQVPPPTHKTTLGGHTVSYTVKRSLKARLARLEITPEAGLTVVVPVSCSMDRVQRFLKEKSRWILSRLAYYGLLRHRRASGLKDGDTIPYLGRSLDIVIRDCDGKEESVALSRSRLVVAVRPGTTGINAILERWYRARAGEMLTEKAVRQSARMGVTYNRIRLKGQRTLWGSCSRKHNLNFNWRLIMTPEAVIDYVVVHELAHLKEMNHSKRFWQVVAEHCPEWQQHRKWLRAHTAELNRVLRV